MTLKTDWKRGDEFSANAVNGISSEVNNKQDKLVSGENIATINGESLTNGGNINIRGTKWVPVSDGLYHSEYSYFTLYQSLPVDSIVYSLYTDEYNSVYEGDIFRVDITYDSSSQVTKVANIKGSNIIQTHEELDEILEEKQQGTIVSAPIEVESNPFYVDLTPIIEKWNDDVLRQELLDMFDEHAEDGEYTLYDIVTDTLFYRRFKYIRFPNSTIFLYNDTEFIFVIDFYFYVGDLIKITCKSFGYIYDNNIGKNVAIYSNKNGIMIPTDNIKYVPFAEENIEWLKEYASVNFIYETIYDGIQQYNTLDKYIPFRDIIVFTAASSQQYYIPYIKSNNRWLPTTNTIYCNEELLPFIKGWDGAKAIIEGGLDIPEWEGEGTMWLDAKPGLEIMKVPEIGSNLSFCIYKTHNILLPGIWDDIVVEGTGYLLCIYNSDESVALITEALWSDGVSNILSNGMYDRSENLITTMYLYWKDGEFEPGWYNSDNVMIFSADEYGEFDLRFSSEFDYLFQPGSFEDISSDAFDALREVLSYNPKNKPLVDWINDIERTRTFKEIPSGDEREYVWSNNHWKEINPTIDLSDLPYITNMLDNDGNQVYNEMLYFVYADDDIPESGWYDYNKNIIFTENTYGNDALHFEDDGHKIISKYDNQELFNKLESLDVNDHCNVIFEKSNHYYFGIDDILTYLNDVQYYEGIDFMLSSVPSHIKETFPYDRIFISNRNVDLGITRDTTWTNIVKIDDDTYVTGMISLIHYNTVCSHIIKNTKDK